MTLLEEARAEINEADAAMRVLFIRRMKAVAKVAQYKASVGMPVFDPAREAEMTARGAALVEDEALRPYYITFLQNNIEVSKQYQRQLLEAMQAAGGALNS